MVKYKYNIGQLFTAGGKEFEIVEAHEDKSFRIVNTAIPSILISRTEAELSEAERSGKIQLTFYSMPKIEYCVDLDTKNFYVRKIL